jgi:hypothetical protein
MRRMSWLAFGSAMALLGACGGGSGGGNSCTPAGSATVTISATGVSPTQVCLTPGGHVTFTNSQAVQIHLTSIAGCPELGASTSVDATGTKQVDFLNAETCNFGVTEQPGVAAFQGTVAVTATGGY